MSDVTIGSIFAKDIARPIEGVIKADDAEHLATEIDEYVLTGETAAALSDLLEAYTAPVYGGGNGVWISGFFGSGKSHLLKMLAHLLGDVPGQDHPRGSVVDAFTAKAEGDSMLAASLARVARIPATCLLFNIDQKAPLIDKNQTDALLQVFVKVFNEARGYYSGEPSVARFERDLDRRGLLGRFREAFAEIASVPWEQGREEGILQERNVTQAWAKVTGEPPTENILARYEERFTLSIEDFADEVAQWLAERPADRRLLFLADEVGQFIGSDTKLMLNLQTIVESLNTKCGGRAWVCVTSQEDMDGVIGDRTTWQANDFSKIQARFATRMKLTSRDVEEVIEKRLLGKNADGEAELDALYDAQRANFRTLFDFADGAKTYRNYQGREHFTGSYPFVPYQFPLFQAALVGLSGHNVFEGRHASVGERSMLGVIQDVAKELADEPVGAVAPFDLMFSGIGQTVKAAAIRNILEAEKQLPSGSETSTIAIRLLKALFLVKYVDGFTATARNLTVLLYDRFDQDIAGLTSRITGALDLLEGRSYVQRAGTAYEYLTDEEQKIEQEIKNTDIGPAEVSKLLSTIISDDVVKSTTFRHTPTGRDFKYELRLDDVLYSRAHPLAVHYVSPALGQPREVVMAQSMGRDEVRVLLPDDPRLYADLRLHVQTDKYARRRRSSSLTETQRHILDAKSRLNQERRRELVGRVREAIERAEFIINGAQINVRAVGPKDRIDEAMAQLVDRTYTQLSLLDGINYAEPDITRFAEEDPAMIDRGEDRLQPAADEVVAFITAQHRLNATVTVRGIVESFEDKPYGWPLAAILCAVTRLCTTSQVALSLDGRRLKRTELPEALCNGHKHAGIVVTRQRRFDPAAVQRVRAFAQEFFSRGELPADPSELASQVKSALAEERRDLRTTHDAYAGTYPFMRLLDEPLALLDRTLEKPTEWYLEELPAHADDLLDAKENAIDPVRHFLASPQKGIYDDAMRLVGANRDNLAYLHDGQAERVQALLDDPRILRGQGINRLKETAAALRRGLGRVLDDEREKAAAVVNARVAAIRGSAAWAETTDEARAGVEDAGSSVQVRIADAASVPLIRQIANDFDEDGYTELLSLVETARPHREQGSDEPAAPPRPIVPIRRLPRPRARLLRTTADADAYLEELRAILHEAIDSGKQVSL
ncbi:BREX system P-loop protein BrxC [Propionibacterium acidifaciens]|uniref:BREX system P-loop protein BrxC n=1 Tax=Propionibacterium acidifaciens TaxID=556499 RepID=UPI0028DB0477|nr:BREX system P-loop protein BrxC [Propionibacterium acidifaciens]